MQINHTLMLATGIKKLKDAQEGRHITQTVLLGV